MRPLARFFAFIVAAHALTAAPPARGWEWTADGGAEINASPHGVVDLGLRQGAFSLQLLTDTLDLRYAPETPTGRSWIALRGELLNAGLFVSPWSNGAPDPARSLNASYVGAEAGWIRYLPRSIYGGIAASARGYFFGARDQTRIPVPDAESLVTADLVFGRWTDHVQMYIRAGADVEGTTVEPHVYGEAIFRATTAIAPRLELRAGAAHGQTDLTRTRLGGLNPYVVPLAGAGWAELWVEDFAAARMALSWTTRFTEVGAAVDAAAFEGRIESGLALMARGRFRRLFAEASLGWAPWLPRRDGVLPLSFWFLVGRSWGDFHHFL